MLQKNTQRVLRQAIHPLTWRYRVDFLDLHRNELLGKWNLDRFQSRFKSISGNVAEFVFTNGNFVEAYTKPSKYQDETDDSLRRLCTDVGMPYKLKTVMAGILKDVKHNSRNK